MKTYYATQDIEDMAARGISELILDDDTVLTDLARDAVQRLGVKLILPGRGVQPAGAPTSRPAAAVTAPPPPVARPSGCQHGPLRPSVSPVTSEPKSLPNGAGNTVVDQMVGLVRQLAGKK
jgi:hypothetical protein